MVAIEGAIAYLHQILAERESMLQEERRCCSHSPNIFEQLTSRQQTGTFDKHFGELQMYRGRPARFVLQEKVIVDPLPCLSKKMLREGEGLWQNCPVSSQQVKSARAIIATLNKSEG